MKRKLTRTLLVGAVLAGGAAAFADEPTTVQLQEQIKQLQAKMDKMEADQKNSDAAQAVQKDAAERGSLPLFASDGNTPAFANNWQAGKFTLRSEDGNFVLHPWLQLQARYATSYRSEVPAGGDSDTQSGFEIRRMKLGFDGNVFSPDTTYLFNWATDRNSGNLVLEEAWVRQKFDNDMYLRGGQIKQPFAHESLVSSKKLLGSERSLATDIFTGGDNFVQGVAGGYAHGDLQAEVAFTDGSNEPNKNFQDFPTNAWDYGLAGRVQWKAMGDWKNYDDFSAMKNEKDLLVFGGGVDFSQGGNTSQVLSTADVQWETTVGLAVYGAVYGRNTINSPKNGLTTPATENDLFDFGGVAQVAYLIPDTKWEPFARYGYISLDSDGVPAGVEDKIHEFTVGVNYYWHGHDAKFTLDVSYFPNGTGNLSDSGADVLSSTDDEIVVRAQFQLLL